VRVPWVVVLVVVAVAALWFALGPWVLVAALAALFLPRVGWQVREWLRPERPWRVAGIGAAAVAVLTAVVVVVPDGWLPIPASPGVLVLPDYVGRPAVPDPVAAQDPPQHPHLAPDGSSSMHGDAWASDAYSRSGPLGRQPQVDTAWYGLEECASLAFDSRARLVALCGAVGGPKLRVIDPDSMRPLATKELPGRRDSDVPAWQDICAGAYFYLDDRDRAVLATTDRRVLAVRTSDAEGQPDLTTDEAWDLSGRVPEDDCLVALMPDWGGRIWFVTRDGLVGTLDPRGGRVRTLDLGEGIDNSFAVDETGGVYVVTRAALHRLSAGPEGTPQVTWRTPYDRGTGTKPGQLGQGSGTTPTIIDGGVVAITDNAEPRMHVLFVDRSTGVELCRTPVFEAEESATENSLVSLGSGVVVENNHGYSSPLRTLLGRGTSPGMARVELDGRECRVVWTSDVVAPSSVAKASWRDGLVYAWTKRSTWWGASAWYLTAVDAATGRTRFSVRAGTGAQFNNHYSAVTLAPDGSAWVATLAGLVRVRDRR
jgi:hypothetical protein